ncbi:hypothetical protein BJ138DRAFT_1148820 [Hygrophoropsis aurantiaca]|uniref:Uncharacterized protein n=1 Tax=Hygrophoropsis aurantiaca TaxID=72124 RepID=A0ACB8AI60_9AGAM|nr:hypothetical protein BJ138DRAFT_1148820 [Hygrophoropsis aurantiaca]
MNASVYELGVAAGHVGQVSFVSISLILYDHAITLDQEVDYFWSGPWTISRVMYLVIRYLALALAVKNPHRSNVTFPSSAPHGFIILYILMFTVILICQGVVALRVWYLFPRNKFMRRFAIGLYTSSIIGTSIMAHYLWSDMEREFRAIINPTQPIPIRRIWMLYLPCVIVHTVLFLCKLWRVITSRNTLRSTPLLGRILKEWIYLGSLLFSMAGLASTSNLNVDFAVAVIIVSVCRAMLSIRSLAETWHVEPEWLLNHAELSRVQWKQGGTEGELLVELGSSATDDISLASSDWQIHCSTEQHRTWDA